MGFRLAYLHLIVTHSKGQDQDQGHAIFDSDYIGNVERYGNITIDVK